MNLTRRALPGLLLLPVVAAAQAVHPSVPRRGPNGGQLVVAGGHPIELVVSGTALTLYLNDEDGRPSPSARAAGRVTVQAGGQTATVSLSPAEPNRLVGTLTSSVAVGTRLVFNGALGDGHRVTARYMID
jgi:hypothetical protein